MQTQFEIIKLSDLPVGRKAILISQDINNPLGTMLLQMGCIPGEEVMLRRVGFFRDPMAIEINGNQFSIRREDAQAVNVQLIEEE